MRFGQVVVGSGHMVDAPDRPEPRFPPEAVPRVRAAMARQLSAWDVGAGDLVISLGAAGTDLLLAELALARRATLWLLLAEPAEQYRRRSVEPSGGDWSSRFDQVLRLADRVDVLGQKADAMSGEHANEVRGEDSGTVPGDNSDRVPGDNAYDRTNRWALREAERAAGERPLRTLVVWDEQAGDGAGGTGDFVAMARAEGADVAVIRPADAWRSPNRPYWERQWASGPKRLLALDGGGLRGLISLELLERMESELGGGSSGFVLADYFDYIAGTSTGAIVAAGLALGCRVADLRDMYVSMAPKVFRRRFFPTRLKSFYAAHGLSHQLRQFYGGDVSLGDDRLRTLLLIVLHRTDSDSMWPLSNNTRAKYNERSRRDVNLSFPLWRVVRGSTAAPVYFPPETITIGERPVVFQDGGITPFNNPALLLFEMATAPQYRLNWDVGAKNLLLVSVGTGLAPAAHEQLTANQVHLLFNARRLLRVVMNGSAVENDRLCRVLGECRFGPQIDNEFDDPAVLQRSDERTTDPLFSYIRYNADLSPRGLARLGLDYLDSGRIGRLDGVRSVGDLQEVGRRAASQVDAAHFAGFLPVNQKT